MWFIIACLLDKKRNKDRNDKKRNKDRNGLQNLMMHKLPFDACTETQIVCFDLTGILFYCNAVKSLNWKKFRDFESRDQVFFSSSSVATKLNQTTLSVGILKSYLQLFNCFDFRI